MNAFLTFLISLVASTLQSSIGMGNGIVLMNFLPNMFPYTTAVTLTQISSEVLAITIAIRLFRHVRWKVVLPILIPAMVCSTLAAHWSIGIDTSRMKLALGFMLVALSLYFLLVGKKLSFHPSVKVGILAGIVAGTGAGLFAIGGPAAALYFVPALPVSVEYIASIHCYFCFNNLIGLILRLLHGAISVQEIPVVLLMLMGSIGGTFIGVRFASKINAQLLKRIIYVFIGLNGLLIILQYFLK